MVGGGDPTHRYVTYASGMSAFALIRVSLVITTMRS